MAHFSGFPISSAGTFRIFIPTGQREQCLCRCFLQRATHDAVRVARIQLVRTMELPLMRLGGRSRCQAVRSFLARPSGHVYRME
jgi:hypothetical protein